MLLSAVCCGLVPIGYSFSTRLWQFYALAVINGLMINGITMMAIGVLVNNWFIQKKGIAIGISYSGLRMMAAIMVPVAGSVIENFGWQWGGTGCWVPRGSFFWCRRFCLWLRSPCEMGLCPLGFEPQSNLRLAAGLGLNQKGSAGHRSFWFLMLGFVLRGSGCRRDAAAYHSVPDRYRLQQRVREQHRVRVDDCD